jgi:hypothetical protein
MIELIKAMFKTPSPHMMAIKELENAQRELLISQSAQEYYSRLSGYNTDRIGRLTRYIRSINEGDQK